MYLNSLKSAMAFNLTKETYRLPALLIPINPLFQWYKKNLVKNVLIRHYSSPKTYNFDNVTSCSQKLFTKHDTSLVYNYLKGYSLSMTV